MRTSVAVRLLTALTAAAASITLAAGGAGAVGHVPGAAPRVIGAPTDEGFQAVSCTSATGCTAVGSRGTSTGPGEAIAAGWTGSKWASEVVPAPSGATHSFLLGVSCTSSKACTAVGDYEKSSGLTFPMAATWDGGKWAVSALPYPAGSPLNDLYSVSCTAATSCVAVGTGATGRYVPFAVALTWDGSKWGVVTAPVPAGSAESFLSGVSCSTADACVAVGYDVNSKAQDVALSETWDGTKWTVRRTPVPAGAVASVLGAVACTAATACTAAGGFLPGAKGSTEQVLVETWNGVKWSVARAPEPAGAAGSLLFGISCTSSKACTAVGDFKKSIGTAMALAEAWNGTAWSLQSTPGLVPSDGTALSGISCTSSKSCTAVGAYGKGGSEHLSVAEQWDGSKWVVQSTPD